MAFINQGYHVGTVGRVPSFELAGGLDCVTYTQNNIDYKACTFTSSGVFTVTGDGLIDVMIVSGGGGSGTSHGWDGEGGQFGGGGGAGGMVVETNVAATAGIYAVSVGAGGPGSQQSIAAQGGESWITPQRVLTISNPTNGTYTVGEELTGNSSGATGTVISHSPSTSVLISHDIKDGSGTTLTTLPAFSNGETISGSVSNVTVSSVALSGTVMSATETSVGGGSGGGNPGQSGGSGGGGMSWNWGGTGGGTGVAGQGNNGGGGGKRDGHGSSGGLGAAGGGGGRSAAGGGGQSNGTVAGPGGAGMQNNFRTGSDIPYAGGGGGAGGGNSPSPAAGGIGGGGTGTAGVVNTGGGAGTGGTLNAGGSGIVVIRYDINQ